MKTSVRVSGVKCSLEVGLRTGRTVVQLVGLDAAILSVNESSEIFAVICTAL